MVPHGMSCRGCGSEQHTLLCHPCGAGGLQKVFYLFFHVPPCSLPYISNTLTPFQVLHLCKAFFSSLPGGATLLLMLLCKSWHSHTPWAWQPLAPGQGDLSLSRLCSLCLLDTSFCETPGGCWDTGFGMGCENWDWLVSTGWTSWDIAWCLCVGQVGTLLGICGLSELGQWLVSMGWMRWDST